MDENKKSIYQNSLITPFSLTEHIKQKTLEREERECKRKEKLERAVVRREKRLERLKELNKLLRAKRKKRAAKNRAENKKIKKKEGLISRRRPSKTSEISDENWEKIQRNPELMDINGRFDGKRAKAGFYSPHVIENIIKHRKSGLGPRASFMAAGLTGQTLLCWKRLIGSDRCPRPVKYLFDELYRMHPNDKKMPARTNACIYKDPISRERIIGAKKRGFSDIDAFKMAGVDPHCFYQWRTRLTQLDCPAELTTLFLEIEKADAETMGSVLDVLMQEALDNKNWKAANELLTKRWGDSFSTRTTVKNITEPNGMQFNLDSLTLEEQKIFVALGKKCQIKDAGDASVKLLISLPDNKRDNG